MQPQPPHQELIYIFAAGRRLVQHLILALHPVSNSFRSVASHRVVVQVEVDGLDAGMVLKVLAESQRDDKLLILLEYAGQREHGVLPPVPTFHFQ